MKDWFAWIKDDSLRAAADYVLNGGKFDEEDARKALNLLREESVAQTRKQVGDVYYAKHYPAHRRGRHWEPGAPVGLVDHYTGGTTARGTLRWFSNEPRGPGIRNSSAHAVIDRDGVIYIVIDPLERIAWHATWANKNYLGVEHINAGLLLRKTNGEVYYMEGRVYPSGRLPQIQAIDNRIWEPYTPAQLVANIVLKRWLIDALPTLNSEYFTEHADIDPHRKIDCGPLWPLFELNDLVFSRKIVRGMKWQEKEVLGVEDIAALKKEVNAYLDITPCAL